MHRHLRTALALAVVALFAVPAAQAQSSFVFPLYGNQEVPPRPTDAQGHCVGIISKPAELNEQQLLIHCTHNVENAIAAHIHFGARGENGGVVFPLGPPPNGDPTSPIFAIWDDDDVDFPFNNEMLAAAMAEQLYVNIHSDRFPTGEVRGQFVRAPEIGTQRTFVSLSADDVVPPSGTGESGACVLSAVDGDDEATIHCVHDVDGAGILTLRRGAPGTNGPILFSFDGASPVSEVFPLDPAIVEALEAGELYIQVAAGDVPRIRGQANRCVESATTLCLQEGRFRVEADFSTVQNGGSSGEAQALRINDDSGSFWFFSPDNTEILIKVLDGCSFNDRFWVFFAATTNVGFTVKVTDLEGGVTEEYTNVDLTEAEPVLDTNAFATCP